MIRRVLHLFNIHHWSNWSKLDEIRSLDGSDHKKQYRVCCLCNKHELNKLA